MGQCENTGYMVAEKFYFPGDNFHAPGKPMGSRDLPLGIARTPTLVLQGERDSFGPRAEIESFEFGPGVTLHIVADGDHSLVPRKSSGRSKRQNWDEAVEAIVEFVNGLNP